MEGAVDARAVVAADVADVLERAGDVVVVDDVLAEALVAVREARDGNAAEVEDDFEEGQTARVRPEDGGDARGRSATRRSSSSGSVTELMSDASEDPGASSARASREEDARAIPKRVPRARPKRAAVEPRDDKGGRGPTARPDESARGPRDAARRLGTGRPATGAFTATGADIVSSRARVWRA